MTKSSKNRIQWHLPEFWYQDYIISYWTKNPVASSLVKIEMLDLVHYLEDTTQQIVIWTKVIFGLGPYLEIEGESKDTGQKRKEKEIP